MALPEQVRRMSERANELLNQVNSEPGEPTPAPEPAPTPQEPAPAEPAPEPTPAPAEPTPAPPAPPVDSTDWAQKYRTLQGVFNAEQTRWNTEKKGLEARLAALEAQATQPTPAPAPATKLVTDKDLETYGPELIDMVNRAATERAEQIVAAKLGELKPELERTQADLTQVKTQVYATKEDKFFGELEKACPEYATINTDPRFGDWLAVVDELSGKPRQSFLDEAANRLDHAHVARMFNAFKATLAPAPAAAPAPNVPTPSPSPRTVGNASAPAPREPQTGVKRTEIAAHYRRASNDEGYRHGAAYKAMEERIATAMASGNIIEA